MLIGIVHPFKMRARRPGTEWAPLTDVQPKNHLREPNLTISSNSESNATSLCA